eukprot:TRINITY_DN4729_c0_g1_i1.p1 TRINITY_DN4729_c0_g1~~TRINITY_DN4729_c0_g1_i1.p1  ORF type:complete len:301 (+),score=44.12 TRINITY_DN4729_c0_g1_i1:105-905(+)
MSEESPQDAGLCVEALSGAEEPPHKRRKVAEEQTGGEPEAAPSTPENPPVKETVPVQKGVSDLAPIPPEPEVEDLLVNGWLYLDSFGKRQGPFETAEMQEWRYEGYLTGDLQVRRVHEENFGPLKDRAILSQAPPPRPAYYVPPVQLSTYTAPDPVSSTSAITTPYQAPVSRPPRDGSYVQSAAFSTLGGRFKAQTPQEHWSSKGLADDKAGRMMAHYFDVDSYQQEMQEKARAEALESGKRKLTKSQLKFFKKRKELKRARNMLK